MAFEKDLLEQEDQEKEEIGMQPLTQQSASGPTSSGGQSGQQRAATSKPGSGMFTNIQKYQTKESEDEANKMASDIGQKYEDRFNTLKTQTEQGVADWKKTQYEPEYQRLNTASDKVKQYINEAGTQTSDVLAERAKEMQALRQGSYNDPVDINLTEQKRQAEALQKQLSDPSSENISREALKNVYERPDYFQGMRNLDYMLMRQQGAQDILRNKAQSVAQQVGDYDVAGQEAVLQQQDNDLGELARSYQVGGEGDQTNLYTEAETDLNADIMGRAEAEKQRRMDEFNKYNQSGEDKLYTQFMNPSSYRDLSQGELMTQEDQARYNALSQLSGREMAHEAPIDTFGQDIQDVLGKSFNDRDQFKYYNMDNFYAQLNAQRDKLRDAGYQIDDNRSFQRGTKSQAEDNKKILDWSNRKGWN